MTDIAGNSTTTAVVGIGDTVTGTLEVAGDHDWFKLQLTAGQEVTITLTGISLEDPYLRIRDSAGNIIFENDDISAGVVRDSKVSFVAPSSGTYYVDVGAWNEGYTGDYQLKVAYYAPPPLWNHDQVADFLTSGYWGGSSHNFNVTQGGTITVNITALTPAGQTLAREALALWSDIIGVNFAEVTTGGQITFDDNEAGANAESTFSGGITTSAHVNISTQWLADYGTTLGSYSFQTYIHEIGHALGLGHAGYYNGSANYRYDAQFENDGWPTTVMSYFDQQDSTHFANRSFSAAFVATPMLADVVAISQLYGVSTTTRTGDTTYGFNSNAGRDVYNASLHPSVAYTVFDSGGTDTLDYSGFSANQRIDLAPESFSNVGGRTGNVSIARGTMIENAIGGSGDDELRGNELANRLTGGAGNDGLYGLGGDDWLIGGSGDDRLVGGDGYDTADYSGAAAAVTVTGQIVTSSVGISAGIGTDELFEIERIIGSEFADSIAGGDISLRIEGRGGDDLLQGGASADELHGGDGDDRLLGGGGNDRLYGEAGADSLAGGPGDDIYHVDSADTVIELPGEGTDLVLASFSYSLGADVENLTLTGSAATNATGNALANTLTGNGANNIINGGLGIDRMVGGLGDDTYYVHDSGDVVVEGANAGFDHVASLVSYALSANVEQLTLVGIAAIDATGNALDNILTGNSANNILNGGLGNDRMAGGLGDDTYYVHDSGDVVVEGANAGFDHVASLVSYTLSANVEQLTLVGSAAINATGNALANTLTGNSANNILNGSLGNDWMAGGLGDDTYYVHDSGDVVVEGANAGFDHVASLVSYALSANVEQLTLVGSAAINATGNDLANRINGNSGANAINGGGGNDILWGGAGADTFLFDSALDSSANVDRILDFTAADDTIALDLAIFSAAGAAGTLAASAFHVGSAAQDADDRIIYDSATGDIYYDADGNGAGAAILFAQIGAGAALTSSDFLLV